MSWDCTLVDATTQKPLEADKPIQLGGGTYAVGGTKELTFNVTYNYSGLFRKVLGGEGLNDLSGKTGADSIYWLMVGYNKLGDKIDPDYWQPTEGNAKQALLALMQLARMRPDGVWEMA
jgi:hypothetical protein